MSLAKRPYGKLVRLLVDLQGFPDGRLVIFEIWRRKDQQEEKICEVYGVTKGGRGIGEWTPEFAATSPFRPLEKKISQQVKDEAYYFIAKIDDKEVKSEDLKFTYPLDIVLKDADDKPIDGVKCTITFSDGTKRKEMVKDGHVRIDDAPSGTFEIELEGFEIEL